MKNKEKNNKKLIFIIIGIILVIVLIIAVVASLTNNKEDNNNELENNGDPIYNTEETILDEYTLKGTSINNIEYYYQNTETFIRFTVTNNTEESVTLGYFTITIKDASGNQIVELLANLATPIEAGESEEMIVSTVGNYVDGHTLEFKEYQETSLEDINS